MDEEIPDIDGSRPPRLCQQLAGQDAAVGQFMKNLADGRVHHAWILTGAKGIGKASFAYQAAGFLLHHKNPVAAANDANTLDIPADSESRQLIMNNAHPDLMVITRPYDEKKNKFKTAISIDDIRKIRHFFQRTAGMGGWRVCIVDCADEMTISAANALLKSLEEPPTNALFFIIAHHPGKLLPTILSRCTQLPLKPVETETVNRLLVAEKPELDSNAAAAISYLGNGSIGRALEIADQDGLDVYREMIDLLAQAPALDIAALHQFANRVANRKNEAQFENFFIFLTEWLHRMVRDSAAGQATPVLFEGEGQAMTGLLANSRLEDWVEVWEKVTALCSSAKALNLDRKQTVIECFSLIERASKAS